jgi:hypothetical protein
VGAKKRMAVVKQGLLILAIAMIVVGSIVWLVPWPAAAEPATTVAGQVVFWIGIGLLILWGCIAGYYMAKT